jgi:hypothetical protein
MAGQIYNPQTLPNPATLETGLWHGLTDGQGELNWGHFWRTGDTAIVRDGAYLRHTTTGSFKGLVIPDFITNDPDVRPGDWWVVSENGLVNGNPVNSGQMVAVDLYGDLVIVQLTLEADVLGVTLIPPGELAPNGNVIGRAKGQNYAHLAAGGAYKLRDYTFNGTPGTSEGWV